MARRKTHEEYVAEVAVINPNIEVVGEYINNEINILHKCKINECLHEWNVKPKHILRGQGCPKCNKIKRTKTHEKYIKEVASINSNIEVIGKYINDSSKILHKCRVDGCGYEWYARPNNILHGRGCPKCGGTIKKTHEEYVDELNIKNNNIEVIEKYINADTPILHLCKIDGYKWFSTPNNILRGQGCPKCGILSRVQKQKKTHEEYVTHVAKINKDIKVVGLYVNTHTKILHRCLNDNCNNEWLVEPSSILSGHGCPQCNTSNGERNIKAYLTEHDIDCVHQHKFSDCINIRSLPFDFYLPKYNVCIEYDGIQHYEPIDYFGGKERFEYIQQNDSIKNKYCKDNNITLLRIRYDENIEEVLDNFFRTV